VDTSSPALVLVVIAGPQASGKSAISMALAAELRRRGERVALVELDQIAAMALPTLPSWDAAHQITELVTGRWARAGLTCVITEGAGTAERVAALLAQTPPDAVALTVVTTAPFEIALARAQADPTRGVSRESDYLGAVYDRWTSEIARIDSDVVLDTSVLCVEQSVERIRVTMDSARSSRSTSR